MSASVASSSAVGLLDRHYSPPTVSPEPAPDARDWRESMEIDPPATTQNGSQQKQHTTDDAQAENDRRNTIGGLLAALATSNASPAPTGPQRSHELVAPSTTIPNNVSPNVPASVPPRKSASPPADSPLSQMSPVNLPQTVVEGKPAADDANSMRLPSVEPNMSNTLLPASTAQLPAESILSTQIPSSHAGVPEISAEDIQSMQKYQEEHPVHLHDFDMNMPIDPFGSEPPHFRQTAPIGVKRVYDAFARFEFADGTFYLNTYQCEIGRDQHAYKDAMRREQEAKEAAELGEAHAKSSSGKASQRVNSIKAAESQVQRSVVSESGGFAGVDEKPVEAYGDKRNGQDAKKRSSQASESSVVRPSEVLHNPSLAPFDYHKDVVYQSTRNGNPAEGDSYEDERPAPVTAAHMPDPSSCPLIPIHPTLATDQSEANSLRAISRRHIRIEWDWDESAFFMYVLGRNGAFFENEHIPRGERVKLFSGARIQISAVEIYFRLPTMLYDADHEDEESAIPSGSVEVTPTGYLPAANDAQGVKLKREVNADGSTTQVPAPNGEVKRRGPGRPPKNGIMSQREMKEREKAEKEAKIRAPPGGPASPTQHRKASKSQLPKAEALTEAPKAEKRKYTKRKREDGEEEEVVLPSIESQDETPAVETPQPPPPPPAKRARTKSYSPPYKPLAECTQEDLARPPHNYAVLLYMVLSETGEITLRQIYKQMQSRWPYFKYVVDSDGWTSSVRHNLNQEVGKLFERGRKEGKGFTWLPKPNAMEEYQAQKNKRSNAPPAPKPRPNVQRPNFPPNQAQQLTWQNSGPMPQPQPNHPGNNFVHQGPWTPQQNPAGRPPQPGMQSSASGNPQHAHSQHPAHGTQSPQPLPSDFVPKDEDMHKFLKYPAPKFMPVTFEGMAVIHRFQETMMNAVATDEEKRAKWRSIFSSVRQRCLHGAKQSTLEGGEIPDEKMIMEHVQKFVSMYKNKNFQGFDAKPTPPATPVVAPSTVGPKPAASSVSVSTQVSSAVNSGASTGPNLNGPNPSTTATNAATPSPSDVISAAITGAVPTTAAGKEPVHARSTGQTPPPTQAQIAAPSGPPVSASGDTHPDTSTGSTTTLSVSQQSPQHTQPKENPSPGTVVDQATVTAPTDADQSAASPEVSTQQTTLPAQRVNLTGSAPTPNSTANATTQSVDRAAPGNRTLSAE